MKAVYAILGLLTMLICYALTNPSNPVSAAEEHQTSTVLQNSAAIKRIKQQAYQSVKADIPSQLVDSCRRFIGTPHHFGGVSKQGIDCSGLLYVNFKSVGMKIPRNSDKQSEFFGSVAIADVQVGDVLFFGTTANDISHTGVVTTVDEENSVSFIHTSTSKGVIEEELRGKYWTSKLQIIGRPDYEAIKVNG